MKKQPEPIDVSMYLPLLREADKAYRTDVAYSVSICMAARSIESKRDVWKIRLQLREASKKAQKACRQAEPFACVTESPCGTGSCQFAEGLLQLIDVPECPGNTTRPQLQSRGPYGLESAVEPLKKLTEAAEELP